MEYSAAFFNFCFLYSARPIGKKKSICQQVVNSISVRHKCFVSDKTQMLSHQRALLELKPDHCSICFAQETPFAGYCTRKHDEELGKLPKGVHAMLRFFQFLDFSYLFFFPLYMNYLPKARTLNSPTISHQVWPSVSGE